MVKLRGAVARLGSAAFLSWSHKVCAVATLVISLLILGSAVAWPVYEWPPLLASLALGVLAVTTTYSWLSAPPWRSVLPMVSLAVGIGVFVFAIVERVSSAGSQTTRQPPAPQFSWALLLVLL